MQIELRGVVLPHIFTRCPFGCPTNNVKCNVPYTHKMHSAESAVKPNRLKFIRNNRNHTYHRVTLSSRTGIL